MRRALILALALGAALVLPSVTLAAGTLDQQQVPGTTAWCFSTPHAFPAALAQVFTAGRTGPLTAVSVYPSGTGLGKIGVHLEIQALIAGHPGGTVLATAAISTNAHDKWVKVGLRQAPAVTQGVQYAIVVVLDTSTGACLAGANPNPYAGGGGWVSGDLVNWDPTDGGSELGEVDFAFQTYVG